MKTNPTTETLATPLRAGTQTGSLMNHLFSGMRMTAPEIGMGATQLCWSDRHACTITEVSKSGKRIGVVADIATRVDKNGMSDSMKGSRLAIGDRSEYHDFSF